MHLEIDLSLIFGLSAIALVAIIGAIVIFAPDMPRKPKVRRTHSSRRTGGGYNGGSSNEDLNPFSPMSPLYSATMSSFDS